MIRHDGITFISFCFCFLFLVRLTILQNGGDDVSIFLFNCHAGTENQLSMARNSVKRLKTLRHPSVLQYLDSHEVRMS